jgi:hypothetical protein
MSLTIVYQYQGILQKKHQGTDNTTEANFFNRITTSIYNWVDKGQDRVPFGDWYSKPFELRAETQTQSLKL